MRDPRGGNGVFAEGRGSRSRQRKAPDHDAGLTSVKGEEGREKIGWKSLTLQCSSELFTQPSGELQGKAGLEKGPALGRHGSPRSTPELGSGFCSSAAVDPEGPAALS